MTDIPPAGADSKNLEFHSLTTTAAAVLTEHAAAIRQLGKRVVADVTEIGRRLIECKKICGHGNWLPWIEREFGWTEQTALNFIRAHDLSKSKNFLDLDLPVSALYLLAAPSTPTEARDTVIERAKAGEPVSVAEVKRTIDTVKARKWSRERYKRHRAKKRAREQREVEEIIEAHNAEIDRLIAEAEQLAVDPIKLDRNFAQRLEAHLGEGMWLKDALRRLLGLDGNGADPDPDDGLDIPASLRRDRVP